MQIQIRKIKTLFTRFWQSLIILTAILAVTGATVSAQSGETEHLNQQFPALTGAKAIEYLKQNGDYQDFYNVLTATQKNNLSQNEVPIESTNSLILRNARLTASDGANDDYLGESVSISGLRIVIGTDNDDNYLGSAYVFVRVGGNWVQEAKLVAADRSAVQRFGAKVAISGNTIAVSAPSNIFQSNLTQGAVYLFNLTGSGWIQQQKITQPNPVDNNRFGISVGLDKDTLAIGATRDVNINNFEGLAYIFVRNGALWSQQQRIVASDAAASNFFGTSISVSGETVVIGSPGGGSNNQSNGAAYIFTRNNTFWTQQQKLTVSDGAVDDKFGNDVAISGNTIVVGAYQHRANTNETQGAAYIFVKNGASWTQQVKLTQNIPEFSFDNFGLTVGIHNNAVLIGSSGGRAYLYLRNGNAWNLKQTFISDEPFPFAEFGQKVALHNNNYVITAASTRIGSNFQQGAVYVYQPTYNFLNFDGDAADDISVFRNGNWYINNSSNGFSAAQFGLSSDRLAPGDFNGDGVADVSVYRNGFWYRIRSSDNVFVSNQFGTADDVPVSGDFNGNGTSDVAVWRPSNGTWYWLLPTLQAGAVAFGAPTDKPVPADFDGDGTTDVAVFRPSNGSWYWLNSSTGQFRGLTFGAPGDIPLVGDYDGDGRADQAVFRPANGTWYLLQSTAGFAAFQWGAGTDKPVPADYDGDGRTDAAVFRDGTWYILRSSGGVTTTQFGAPGDRPVPAAFVQ